MKLILVPTEISARPSRRWNLTRYPLVYKLVEFESLTSETRAVIRGMLINNKLGRGIRKKIPLLTPV